MNRVQKFTYRAIMGYTTYVKGYLDLCGHFQLEQDLCFDNLDRVELLMELEDTFGIDLQEDNLKGWYTVEDVIDSVIQAGGR